MFNAEILPLFSSPVYKSSVPLLDSLEVVKNVDYEIIMPSADGFISKNRYILDIPELSTLKEQILLHINYFTAEILKIDVGRIQFYITNSWAMQHVNSHQAGRHFHSNSLFSGVYYIQCDDDSGQLFFHSKEPDPFSSTIGLDRAEWNILNSPRYSFTPEQGDLFIFPSALEHSVGQHNSSVQRYCIAFNVFVEGTVGESSPTMISALELKRG